MSPMPPEIRTSELANMPISQSREHAAAASLVDNFQQSARFGVHALPFQTNSSYLEAHRESNPDVVPSLLLIVLR
ncbi:hypothetical protein D3C73_1366360 [compost metagenome]